MTYQGAAIPTGVVQDTYPSQMATALAGMLANATDQNLVDSLAVLGANSILAGRAAFYKANTTNARTGINQQGVQDAANALTAGVATVANFAGVALRTLAGWSATAASPLWPTGVMAPIARPGRSGCRIWVETTVTDTVVLNDLVYVVISNLVSGNTRAVGSFVNAVITGNGQTDTLLLTGANFKSAGLAALQLVEFTTPVATADVTAAVAQLTEDVQALEDKDVLQDAGVPIAEITASAEVSHARTITIQVNDVNGDPIAARHELRLRVNASASYTAASATATDTFAGPTAGAILNTITAKAEYDVVTDATGKYVFVLTHNDAGTSRYFTVEVGGRVYASGAIAFDAVG